MGNSCTSAKAEDSAPAGTSHTVYVKTGDKKGAETDGNIFVNLADEQDKWGEEKLIDTKWKNDFERGNTDVFHLSYPELGKIGQICIRRDETAADDAWYLEKIVVLCQSNKLKSYFPVNRWIHANSTLKLSEFDSSLPFEDKHPEQRQKELEKKREQYKLIENIPGAPYQVESLPDDERFTNEYQWDIQSTKLKLYAQTTYINLTTPNFDDLKDFENVYGTSLLPTPYGANNWRSDAEFGNQRLSGCNPLMIKLCTGVPDYFPVTGEMVESFLEGKTLQEAIDKKKLYILDLRYLAEMECTDNRKLPGPIGLFYVQNGGDLVPIAIQLMPVPGEDNPIFLPSDPEYTWLAAKMWFNLADCSHHQSVTHLGFTHLIIESVAVCTHRQLSPSHPVFRLLAPHFLYLLAINTLAVSKLVGPGGWVDETMQIGRVGMFNIIKANWAEWNLNQHGDLPADLKHRGVDDVEALPKYHYRDDALLLWNAMLKYIKAVIDGVYDTPEKLAQDKEIQGWASELADAKIKGVPSSFSNNEELSHALASFMFIGSVGHAAANFCQYDEYAFPPNYPSMLRGEMPKDKKPLDESYVVNCLPSKKDTLSIMIVTKLLSQRGTNALTDFEVQYAFDPITTKALEQFKADLKEVGATIEERNAKRDKKYVYLHPNEVPNAISI